MAEFDYSTLELPDDGYNASKSWLTNQLSEIYWFKHKSVFNVKIDDDLNIHIKNPDGNTLIQLAASLYKILMNTGGIKFICHIDNGITCIALYLHDLLSYADVTKLGAELGIFIELELSGKIEYKLTHGGLPKWAYIPGKSSRKIKQKFKTALIETMKQHGTLDLISKFNATRLAVLSENLPTAECKSS